MSMLGRSKTKCRVYVRFHGRSCWQLKIPSLLSIAETIGNNAYTYV